MKSAVAEEEWNQDLWVLQHPCLCPTTGTKAHASPILHWIPYPSSPHPPLGFFAPADASAAAARAGSWYSPMCTSDAAWATSSVLSCMAEAKDEGMEGSGHGVVTRAWEATSRGQGASAWAFEASQVRLHPLGLAVLPCAVLPNRLKQAPTTLKACALSRMWPPWPRSTTTRATARNVPCARGERGVRV